MAIGVSRKIYLQRTNGNVLWSISQEDHFNIKRIGVIFETTPGSIHNVKLWHKDGADTAFDCLIRTEDPNGSTYVTFENVDGFFNGDFAQLEFTNEDSIYLKGFAVLSI